MLLDDGGAEETGIFGLAGDTDMLIDDVENFVDHEADAATAIGVHDYLHGPFTGGLSGKAQNVSDAHERHDFSAVLHDLAIAGEFRGCRIELLKARDHGERNSKPAAVSDAEEQP